MNIRTITGLAVLAVAPLTAQLAPPNAAGVSMGHIQLVVADVDAQKAFWISIMGGKLVSGRIQFPGVYITLRKATGPLEPPAGSIVNHFGMVVKDMPGALAKWKAAKLEVEPTENPNESYVHGPDGVRVEVYGVPDLPVPIQMNHLHIYPVDIPAMKAWYVKTFGATPGQRACVACVSKPRMIETGDIPGVNLSFSQGDKVLAPTKGRVLDHIGFEVTNIEAFVKKLEAQGIKFDQGVREIPANKLKTAFLTDPWGINIELTEGLAAAN